MIKYGEEETNCKKEKDRKNIEEKYNNIERREK